MPNTKSAKKALRQSEARMVKNLTEKRRLKKTIKLYESLLGTGNTKDAETQLATTYKALDKAAKSGVIKKNKAGRLKSKLAVKLSKSTAPQATQNQAEQPVAPNRPEATTRDGSAQETPKNPSES